jgi:hypothetical protein
MARMFGIQIKIAQKTTDILELIQERFETEVQGEFSLFLFNISNGNFLKSSRDIFTEISPEEFSFFFFDSFAIPINFLFLISSPNQEIILVVFQLSE